MRDERDPEELYMSILATQKHFGCTILEAADRVEAMRDRPDELNTNGRNSYVTTNGSGAAVDTDPGEPRTDGRAGF